MARLPSQGTKSSTGRTILCVDDQQEFLDATRMILEREGHRVLTSTTGQGAVAILEAERVDVLLLDYFMPEMGAEDVLVEVRDPTLQVVLLTGYSSEKPPREMMQRLDIQGYCDKSRGPDELLLWVELALRHSSVVRQLEASSRGLRQVLSSCLRQEERLTFQAEIDSILEEASEVLDIRRAIIALAPLDPDYLPPSLLEESSFTDTEREPELRVMAGIGPCQLGETIDSQLGPELTRAILQAPRLESDRLPNGSAVLPLRADGRWLGAMWVESSPRVDSPQWEILNFFSVQIANRCLVRQGATIDPITGLQSKRFWTQVVWRDLRQAFRYGDPACVVVVSLEGLDRVRLIRPRQADAMLESLGKLIRNSVRGTDLCGRGDHDEIVVFLSRTEMAGALRFAELLSQRLEEILLPFPEGPRTAQGNIGIGGLSPHAFDLTRLPRPMPAEYFPGVERLVRARANASTAIPSEESPFPVFVHADTSWPDPHEVARANIRKPPL